MLRFFDPQVNLSTDQGRIREIEVTAGVTGIQEASRVDGPGLKAHFLVVSEICVEWSGEGIAKL